jgi:hypothetical protein
MPLGSLKGLATTSAAVQYTVFLTPSFIHTDVFSLGSGTSSTVTVNVSGGVEPFSYVWTKISGDPITVNDGAPASVTFSANSSNGLSQSAVFQVEVSGS